MAAEALNVKLDVPARAIDKSKCGMCDRRPDENNRLEKFCSTCPTWLCGSCVLSHQRLPALKSHQLLDDQTSQTPVYTLCSLHGKSFLTYFCRNCASPVCADCRLGTDHTSHQVVDIDVKVEENKRQLDISLSKKKALKTELERVEEETKSKVIEAKKKLFRCSEEFQKVVDQQLEQNKQINVSYLAQLKEEKDKLVYEIKTAETLKKSPEEMLTMTDLATMSALSDRVIKETPSYDGGPMTLIGLFVQATFSNILDEFMAVKNGAAERNERARWRIETFCKTDPELMKAFRAFLKTNAVTAYDSRQISCVQSERVSIVPSGWYNTYNQWIKGDQNMFPGEVEYWQEGEYSIPLNNVLFLSDNDARFIRSVFGCYHSLPVGNKSNLEQFVCSNSYAHYDECYNDEYDENDYDNFPDCNQGYDPNGLYVLRMKEIKHVNDTNTSANTRLLHGSESLFSQNERVFRSGSEVSYQVRGQSVASIFSSLGLRLNDELCVLKQ